MERRSKLDLLKVGYGVIEPPVRGLVRVINALGVTTVSSHGGNVGDGEDEGGPTPWVALALWESEAANLVRLMRYVGQWRMVSGASWGFRPFEVIDESIGQDTLLYLRPWSDNKDEDPEELRRLQAEAAWLAEYLLELAAANAPSATDERPP